MVETYVSVDAGAFDPADAMSLACHGGGRVGEECVAEGAPAGSDVGEVGDDEGGFLVVFVADVNGFGAAPGDSVVAECPEGDVVAAGLVGEAGSPGQRNRPSAPRRILAEGAFGRAPRAVG